VRVELVGVSHIFNQGTPVEKAALSDVNLKIEEGECVLIGGCTGSGKSTLLQIMASLLEPTSGYVLYDGERKKGYEVRRKLGVAFQYPEDQFFAETVYEEVSFAVRNFYPGEDPTPFVKRALEFVGLDYEEYKDRSPFFLSGGEKRRVAIASVIVHDPEVLLLDEPFVGLDLEGRHDLVEIIKRGKEKGKTIVVVSHNLEVIFSIVDRVIFLEKGRVVFDGGKGEFLMRYKEYLTSKLSLMRKLLLRGQDPFTLDERTILERLCDICE